MRRKALDRLEYVFGENYLNIFINTYKIDLREKLRVENFHQARVEEKKVNEAIGIKNALQEQVIREKVEELISKISGLGITKSSVNDVVENEKQWFLSELQLQQQESMLELDEEKKELFEAMRCLLDRTKNCENSKMYLSMLRQAEIEYDQYEGRISKKLYNRIIAAHVAIGNRFEQAKSNYNLNSYTYKYISQSICPTKVLEECYGNGIQHNVHGKIVSIVNRYSYYLHANNKDIVSDGPNLYEAANIALDMKDKLDGKETNTKIYERTYSFLDFCHNLLKVKIGTTALNICQRFGRGLEEGKGDIQKKFSDCMWNHSTWVERFFC